MTPTGADRPSLRQAVLFRDLNGQILNGGLRQWLANGYGAWIDDVVDASREVGTATTREVAALLEDLSSLLKAGYQEDFPEDDESLDEEDEAFRVIGRCEDRYYNVQSQFVADVEAWLEAKAAARP